MTGFSGGVGRVSNMMMNRMSLAALERANLDLFRVSMQLSTGRAIVRPSDDAVKAATISTLDASIARSGQVRQNLGYAGASLDTLDGALGDALNLLREASDIASAQLSTGTSAEERSGQAKVVNTIIDSLFRVTNSKSLVGHVFGGKTPGTAPLERIGSAFRFAGSAGGLLTDLGGAGTIPVTMGANNALGSTSARVRGDVDLEPRLTMDTRLKDLDGARGVGVTQGAFRFAFNGGDPVTVDVTGADTVGDVVRKLESALIAHENETGQNVLGPGGVGINGTSITIDVAGGDLAFTDLPGGSTGADLGLVLDPAAPFGAGQAEGAGVAPRLTWTTPVDALAGIDGGLGRLRIRNNGMSRVVDLSGAETLGDVRNRLQAGNIGVRVEISEDGRSINVRTEIAGSRTHAMSIEEVDGGGMTATRLGIRSLSASTRLADFNDGRGVTVNTGATDPETGDPAPERDVDFTIHLGDGFRININLAPEDTVTVDTLLAAVNAQADAQLAEAGRPATDFEARLSDTVNGLVFRQAPGLGDSMKVEARNNSPAAEQLGLVGAKRSEDGTTLITEDRATVRPDNMFTYLSDLHEALERNDTNGIQFAAKKLDEFVTRLSQSRGLVGGYARRVDAEMLREEDRTLLDETVRSQLRDLDFAEATTRFAMLEMQLQAGLTVAAQSSRLTLLDFLR